MNKQLDEGEDQISDFEDKIEKKNTHTHTHTPKQSIKKKKESKK